MSYLATPLSLSNTSPFLGHSGSQDTVTQESLAGATRGPETCQRGRVEEENVELRWPEGVHWHTAGLCSYQAAFVGMSGMETLPSEDAGCPSATWDGIIVLHRLAKECTGKSAFFGF